LIDANSGAVLYQDHATQPWYPASVTKLMTVYVALQAVRDHKIGFDTPLVVSARAASMPPSKMGFRPGSMVTLGNALKMLMVKSANDVAVTIAEGVAGSVEAFAEEMNASAASLGLTQSHFVNPNGLPDPNHVSSARDLAILARALYLTYPDQADLFAIGALRLGNKIIANHNNLLGRYPGVDGMKTGFTCSAGFNVVASASLGGRRLIAVVLGSPTATQRMIKAAALFDRGFAGVDQPSATLANLPQQQASAVPDMHDSVCRARARAIAESNAEVEALMAPLSTAKAQDFVAPERTYFYNSRALAGLSPMASRIAMTPPAPFDPVPVFAGPPADYAGPIAQPRPPHSPIGTPGPAIAYAPSDPQLLVGSGAPLASRPDALPMKRGKNRGAAALAHLPLPMPAASSTKLIEGDDESGSAAAVKTSRTKAVKARTAAASKASIAKAPIVKGARKAPAAHVASKPDGPKKSVGTAVKPKTSKIEKHAKK
jgi:D-alanyl-D-alanine carboxypeptidase